MLNVVQLRATRWQAEQLHPGPGTCSRRPLTALAVCAEALSSSRGRRARAPSPLTGHPGRVIRHLDAAVEAASRHAARGHAALQQVGDLMGRLATGRAAGCTPPAAGCRSELTNWSGRGILRGCAGCRAPSPSLLPTGTVGRSPRPSSERPPYWPSRRRLVPVGDRHRAGPHHRRADRGDPHRRLRLHRHLPADYHTHRCPPPPRHVDLYHQRWEHGSACYALRHAMLKVRILRCHKIGPGLCTATAWAPTPLRDLQER